MLCGRSWGVRTRSYILSISGQQPFVAVLQLLYAHVLVASQVQSTSLHYEFSCIYGYTAKTQQVCIRLEQTAVNYCRYDMQLVFFVVGSREMGTV